MIIVMRSGAQKKELKEVLQKIRKLGYKTHIIHGVERDVIGAIGDERGKARLQSLESLSGVEKVVPILKPYKLASREVHSEGTVITVGNAEIGGQGFALIAGPCSVESREQIFETAEAVKKAGANILRGEPSNPGRHPTASRGWRRRACAFWPTRGNSTISRLSPRSSTPWMPTSSTSTPTSSR